MRYHRALTAPPKKQLPRLRRGSHTHFHLVQHTLQVNGDLKGSGSSFLDLIDSELGVDLGHQQALVSDLKHAHLGDDLIHAVRGGQGQDADSRNRRR